MTKNVKYLGIPGDFTLKVTKKDTRLCLFNWCINYSTSIAPNGHSNPSSPSHSATAFAWPSSSNSNTSGREPTQSPQEAQSSGLTFTFGIVFPPLEDIIYKPILNINNT